ncbi:tRNA-dihydrouridine synthase [candidate division WWE3 bacterium]|nr:tRNA-dihydrouridine synthase [candidate division WWE3 bacterium]
MARNFWQQLDTPFTVLAPMEDVTDFVFREIIAQTAPPNVFFTEFTNVAGLMSEGRKVVAQRLKFSEKQRPIVAQIWGTDPKNYYEGAKLVAEMGFDGVDINMGCPQRNVVKQGAGAGLIETPKLAAEIIESTKEGVLAAEGAEKIPVSVKTRLGFKKIITKEWAEFLLKQDIAALTMHGRTQGQMSKVPANWDEIKKVVKARDEIAPETVIIGNGDVADHKEAVKKAKKYGVDGVMIGRGIFTNPWAFEKAPIEHTPKEHLDLLLKHTKLFVDTWETKKNFAIMKKFFKVYVRGFEGASTLRAGLMGCESLEEVETIVEKFMNKNF